jgi:hypothetical protein
MANTVNLLSKLNVKASSGIIFGNGADFPLIPSIGQLAFVNKVLYIYSDVNGVPAWFPLLNADVPTYTHTQGLESLTWTITHGLDSEDLMYFVYDELNNVIYPNSIEFISTNQFNISFTESIKGKCLVFSGDLKIVGTSGVADIDGLQDELDAKADITHDHDIRYYTQAQVDTKIESPNHSIVPSIDNTYSLGSPTSAWKDLYVGPGSLYVNGQKVIEDNSGTITIGADLDQNIQVKTGGGGDIEFYPSGTGAIEFKGNISVQSGKVITTNDGQPVKFANGIDLDGNEVTNIDFSTSGLVAESTKGQANGVASLDASGLVPPAQLPSYVDDVVEISTFAMLPVPGDVGKIYVVLENNKIYRWTGSSHIEISATAGTADAATQLATARTIGLSGDVTGSVSFDGTSNVTITTTVTDDSHDHVISNVDGLQTALDNKLAANSNAVSATKLNTARTIGGVSFDGTANISLPGVNIEGNQNTSGNAFTATTATNLSREIVAGIGLTGGGLLNMNRTLNVTYGTVAGTACEGNDSRLSDARTPTAHNHTIANVTNLQTELDGKSNTTHNHDAAYLGITAKAADSDKLDGLNSSTSATVDTIAVRNASGNIYANAFYGDGSNLTGIQGGSIVDQFDSLSTSSIGYDVNGNIDSIIYVTGNKQVINYSGDNVSSVQFYDTDGTTLLKTQSFAYNVDGNVTSITWS